MSAQRREVNGDASLAARAAWLHFAGGLTQIEIARRLNIPSMKAHRLVARALRDGLVRVHVDARVVDCVALEETLRERFGLDHAAVAPDLGEGPLPLKALGLAGAAFLAAAIDEGNLIGIGNGRTISAAVTELVPRNAGQTRFVSVLGGLTRSLAANPFDVIHRLAAKTDGDAFLMPAPVFANSAEDKAVLLAQGGIADVFRLAAAASPILAGIGELTDSGFLVGREMIRAEERRALAADGAVGEILGHFFAADGTPVGTELSARAVSLDLATLKGTRLVAIAGGAAKVDAIRAVLAARTLKGLITDERTAAALVGATDSGGRTAANDGPKRSAGRQQGARTAS